MSHASLLPYQAVHTFGWGNLLREQARGRPHFTAVSDGDHLYSFAALDERVHRLASVLRARGVGTGDRILWLGQNSFRVFEVLLAGARLGAMVCPANWRASAPEVAQTLEDFDPKVIFWQTAEIGARHREARKNGRPGSHWICQDGGDAGDNYEALMAAAAPTATFAPVPPSAPLLALYTAGFSGRPAAALLSHESLLLVAWLSMFAQKIDEHTSYLVSGPMFHVGVWMGALGTLMAGGRCLFVARVDAEDLLKRIARETLTHAYIAPPTIEQMRRLNADGQYDVSSLFSDPQMSDYRMPLVMPRDAPLLRSINGYGQTELGGLVVMAFWGGQAAGRASPFLEIKIGDEAGNELPPGSTGEIFARGPLVMCGYWNRPEENARRVVDGWHRTHDLGKRLPDGSLVFVGPKTTMIKSGVENIYPAEVEACLRQHEGVADVCVIGVPDPTWAQSVKAIIVRQPGAKHAAQDFIEHCRERIASYKKPKLVEFADSLPRNAAGQVDRAAVDAAYGGGGYPSIR
jgi:long-chain acyl-CoA synthetase